MPVAADEYQTMGGNVLPIEPRRVIVVNGNPQTRAALEAVGCDVHGYDGAEISINGGGGPTA